MRNKTHTEDTLARLSSELPLKEKLAYLHTAIRRVYRFVHRIAVALYDPDTDLLKTFIDSNEGNSPLRHYEAKLAETNSLRQMAESGAPRVINDLDEYASVQREHARRIRMEGYGASYTVPIYWDGSFFGFVFFNSRERGVFRGEVLHYLDLCTHLISLATSNELGAAKVLRAAAKSASDIAHQRDSETGGHLDRMARYTRLIAMELADRHELSDEYIEHLFVFAPLHDIGKIAIPDKILLKPGKLTADEYATMKTHTLKGREMVDTLLDNFGLERRRYAEVLRNIAELHHEAIDGSGYPYGLKGEAIPLEARIVAVADVFDALTSSRPYKEAWDNERAVEILRELAGKSLDRECVEAIVSNRTKVEQIQARFREEIYG